VKEQQINLILEDHAVQNKANGCNKSDKYTHFNRAQIVKIK
jgi:hypothetical protein